MHVRIAISVTTNQTLAVRFFFAMHFRADDDDDAEHAYGLNAE